MGYIVVLVIEEKHQRCATKRSAAGFYLTEDASQITARKEDTAATITALYTRLFTEVWRDGIYHNVCSDQARSTTFESVDAAEPWAEVTVFEMGIGFAALLGLLLSSEQLISWDVRVEEILRRESCPASTLCPLGTTLQPTTTQK